MQRHRGGRWQRHHSCGRRSSRSYKDGWIWSWKLCWGRRFRILSLLRYDRRKRGREKVVIYLKESIGTTLFNMSVHINGPYYWYRAIRARKFTIQCGDISRDCGRCMYSYSYFDHRDHSNIFAITRSKYLHLDLPTVRLRDWSAVCVCIWSTNINFNKDLTLSLAKL